MAGFAALNSSNWPRVRDGFSHMSRPWTTNTKTLSGTSSAGEESMGQNNRKRQKLLLVETLMGIEGQLQSSYPGLGG